MTCLTAIRQMFRFPQTRVQCCNAKAIFGLTSAVRIVSDSVSLTSLNRALSHRQIVTGQARQNNQGVEPLLFEHKMYETTSETSHQANYQAQIGCMAVHEFANLTQLCNENPCKHYFILGKVQFIVLISALNRLCVSTSYVLSRNKGTITMLLFKR